MLGVIVIVLLVGGALLVLFWAGTLWFQNYIYSEPAGELYWRAPAAAAAVTLVLALWCFLAYRNPGSYDPLFSSPDQVTEYKHFWSEEKDKGRVLYEQRKSPDIMGGSQYVRRGSPPGKGTWKREVDGALVEAIIVKEGPSEKEVRFELQRPPGGKFRPEDEAHYIEKGGSRVMTEREMGRVVITRRGPIVVLLLLNVVHLAVWFVCLWLLLRFQWSHALGLAFVFWLIMTIWIVPQVIQRTEQAAPKRQPSPALSASEGVAPPLACAQGWCCYPLARTCMMSPSCTMYVLPSKR